MERSEEEWIRLTTQLQALRELNSQLKQQLEDQGSHQHRYNMLRSSVQPIRYTTQTCLSCHNILHSPTAKNKQQLVQEFQLWSHTINSKFFIKNNSDHMNQAENVQSSQSSQQGNQENEAENRIQIQIEEKTKKMKMFEQICLFGPSLDDIQANTQKKKFNCKHQMYYPQPNQKLQVYGHYLFPDEVPVKLIRQKNKAMEVDRIIFKKSYKQPDFNFFIFQCQSECLFDGSDNKLFNTINPFKCFYNISIQFSDYIFLPKAYKSKLVDKNLSMEQSSDSKYHQQLEATSPLPPPTFNRPEVYNRYGETSIYKSNFCLCIMTYFPFVNFFIDILIQLIDQIKIHRMEDYLKVENTFKQLDIKYVSNKLKQIVNIFEKQINNFEPIYGNKLQVSIGGKHLSLNLEQNLLWQQLLNNWSFRVLKLLDKQTLYQLYALIMLQQSICFIGQNSHILTFMIYLFTNILIRPFYYPHPCVSIVFNEELLQTPFTAILSIHKDTKWLDQNQALFLGKKQNKVIINLNEDQIKIKYKKKIKIPKSQRLRKIINNFYKKAQKMEGGSSNKRRELLSRQITKGENQLIHIFINELQTFYQQQLINFMPNREIIQHIKKNIDSQNLTVISNELIKNIQKYILQSRKNIQKDAFIDMLMQKQIFYVYLTTKYEIS